MKKQLFALSLLFFAIIAKSQNIAVPNYNQQKIEFYLGDVSSPSHTLASGVGNVNGVTFYGTDMFVAGNANGILWYKDVSFNPYNLPGKIPTLLITGSGTTQVAVDANGNAYSANENGTVTKFFRNTAATSLYSNSNKVTVRFSNDLTSGITIGKVNNIECVWVNNYTSTSISVARTSHFPASGTVTTINKAIFVKLITNVQDNNNEGIALDNDGNLWYSNNSSIDGYIDRILSPRVFTIVNGLNATSNPNYALVSGDYALHVLNGGYKLGGLTYDPIYTNRMYCNDQPADGSPQSTTRNVLAFNPTTVIGTAIASTVTPYPQTNPGNGQAAIIPCALLPTAIASSVTINAGQTATLTASNCVSGAGYEWYDGLLSVGSGSIFTTPVLSNNKVYTVSCINSAACQSTPLTVNVTVNPVTGPFSITPANLQAICVPSTTLSAVNCGGTVSWYEDVTGGGTNNVFLGTGNTYNFTFGANLTYFVRATCTVGATVSPLSNYAILRRGPLLNPEGFLSGPGLPVTITASGCPLGTTYLWATGETTPTITKSPTVQTGYSVKCTSGTCNSADALSIIYIGNKVANIDNFTVTQGTPFSGNVFTNDEAYSPRTLLIDEYPTHGNITYYDNTGAFTYAATPGYLGTDSFKYHSSGISGTYSNTVAVNLTICPAASTSVLSGDWNTSSTWQCGAIPTATKPVEIQSGHIINVTGNVHAKDVKLIGTGKINYVGTAGKIFLNQ
jgi:Ig-like domain CHU_C associated/Bacterial Ig domain